MGINACELQVRGLQEVLRTCIPHLACPGKRELILGAAEDLLAHFKTSSFDLVFSSPPYFNRDKYSIEPEQSFIRYPTLDQWLDGFLRVVLLKSARLLKRGGRLVVNVGNVPTCLAYMVNKYVRPALRLKAKLNLRLAKLPYKRQDTEDAFNNEPIFVFEKP